MSYPKRLLRLNPKRGISQDLPPHDVPEDFFTDATNVIFRNGIAQRILGSRDAYVDALAVANPAQLMHAQNCALNNLLYWLVYEGDGTAWALQGANATQIDGALLAPGQDMPYLHTSALLNGLPIYSNGAADPVYWDGGAVLKVLPGWTATESCQFIAVTRYHIFALNISGPGGDFPNLVKWSDAAAPGTVPGSWTPASNNEAGSAELSDSTGELVCAYPLRDALAIYKRSAMYLAEYVGGNQIWRIRKTQSASGALGPRAVADIGGRHLVVADGDIVITDGVNTRSIGESRMKEYLFNQLDEDNFQNLLCSYNRGRNEVLIGFPTSGNKFCNKALVYDVNQDSFGKRDLVDVVHAPVGLVADTSESKIWKDQSQVWMDDDSTWSASKLERARGSIVHVRETTLRLQDTDDFEVVGATLIRAGLTFGEPERLKFVKRLHVLRTGGNGGDLLVRVGTSMTPDGNETLTNEVVLPANEQIVNLTAVGRYISVQIRSNTDQAWRVAGIEIEAELRGYH